jgi:hypothetical protein
MRTTALVVEHLAIGIQATIWILLFLFSFWNYDWLFSLAPFHQILFLLLAFAIAYPLGISIDEFSDTLLNCWSERIRIKHLPENGRNTFNLLVALKDPSTSQYFQYLRGRIRMSRSTAVNALFTTIGAVIFTKQRLDNIFGASLMSAIIWEIAVGAVIISLSLFTWWRVSNTFRKRVRQGYDAVQLSRTQDMDSSTQNPSRSVKRAKTRPHAP